MPSAAPTNRVLVGTAGWADRDLVASGWYPASVRTPAARLRHYAERFPLVEVDSAYYAIPAADTVESWTHAAPSLTFDIKAYRLLTGHQTPVASLPKDLRDAAAVAAGNRAVLRSAPAELLDEVWDRFHEAIEPMSASGKLGLVLLQFPPTVVANRAGREQVVRALERCAPLRAAVEWRHASWLAPSRRAEALALLADHGAAYVCVDMPSHSATAMPASLHVTTDLAVIRLHGRSADWRGGDKQERYRYEYSDAQLRQWAANARSLADEAQEVHVVANTCCAGAAQRDAGRLQTLLGDGPNTHGSEG